MGVTEILIAVATATIVGLSAVLMLILRSRADTDVRLNDALDRIGASMDALSEAMQAAVARTHDATGEEPASGDASLDPEEVSRRLLARVVLLPGVDAALVSLPVSDGDALITAEGLAEDEVNVPNFEQPGLGSWSVAELTWHDHPAGAGEPGFRSAVAVPLTAPGGRQGTLIVYSRGSGRLPDETVERCIAIAQAFVPAVANARLFHTTLELVTTDALTGLKNRRGYDEGLRHESERARRTGQPLSLLILDLDDFGLINKEHSLQTGDAVLELFGATLRRTARSADVVCRRGGEEFAVVLPETACREAQLFYARLRAEVDATRFPGVGQLTFSAGLTRLEPDDTPETIDERASRLVNQQKRQGKNGLVHDCV